MPPKFEISPYPAPDISKSLILIVDDVPENLKILHGVLSKQHYRLSLASNGEQALSRVQTIRPDLILLDLMMPDIDGLEVCQRLKQCPDTAAIPIIFLTASHEIDHLVEAYNRGAIDFIQKPFRTPELLARIKTHLTLMALQRQNQQLILREVALRRATQSLHHSLDLPTILQNAVDHIKAYTRAEQVLISRRVALAEDEIVATFDPVQASALEREWTSLQTNVLASVPPIAADVGQPPQICFPIVLAGELWGQVRIQPAAGMSLPEEGQTLLPRIIRQLEVAIQQAELYHRFHNLACTDGLTQLANRSSFNTHLAEEWSRLQREQQPLSVIMIDVDYFKRYNDAYGHLQGDACLKAIAQALCLAIRRPADWAARYGGEEFAVILPQTDSEGAIHVARQIKQTIARLQISHRAHLSSDWVTVSMGIATVVPSKEMTILELLSRADIALYQAKSNGRNGYWVADDVVFLGSHDDSA